jgi:UDP-GlcNAc:undecaprenyl-phosphate/decaprenyl-phosphate GlcNAc-1-phosphate transferase
MTIFPFNLYLLAFVGAFLATSGSMPLWRRWSYRSGLVDDPGHRKIHDQPIALAGGLAVLTGLLLPLVVGGLLLFVILPQVAPGFQGSLDAIRHGYYRRAGELATILFGTVAIAILGWLDDKHELKPGPKFAGQFLIALLTAAAGVRITLFVHNPVFSYAITILWILTVINAFNFMDNMNGLCAGLGMIGAWYFGWSAAVQGQYLVALMSWLACGALLGFLPFNFPKATIFLGDTGSHLVGYLLAVLAILPHFYSKENPRAWAVFSPLLILAVPLADMAWVVVLRQRAGKPFYIGDTNHLSHRLVRAGCSKTGAVLVIWLLAALFGAISML